MDDIIAGFKENLRKQRATVKFLIMTCYDFCIGGTLRPEQVEKVTEKAVILCNQRTLMG